MRPGKLLNKYQKRARRPGECRVGPQEVEQLLVLAASDDADERLTAASYLCPCHVRRPDDRVKAALHRLMEDREVAVRRAAWHTLEDGGGGDSPEVQAIAARVRTSETDGRVLSLIDQVCGSRRQQLQRQRFEDRAASLATPRRRGKCDFCGRVDVMVSDRLDTEIPDTGTTRPAAICRTCEGSTG